MQPYTTLIDAETLIRHIDDPNWVIVDCRQDLTQPEWGREQYAAGHLPGAHFLHLDADLSGPCNGRNGRHPLPDADELAARLGALGIDSGKQVIAYDAHGAMFAARLWWLLRWLGHEAVAVLDGGLQAWLQAGGRLTNETPEVPPTTFETHPQNVHIDAAALLSALQNSQVQLIDARSPDRFRGENETLDPIGGHIPGALNRFFKDNLAKDGRFKTATELRKEWEAVLNGRTPDEVVHQCGSGVTACHNALAMYVAGLPGSRLYPGSWSEWCTDPTRPMARHA